MIEVKNRSVESWGELANMDDKTFKRLVNHIDAKNEIKAELKRKKKLKTYRIQFLKEWNSEYFEIQAENEYDVSSKAREFFKENHETIGFKEKPRGKYGEYAGYDRLSYVKVRT